LQSFLQSFLLQLPEESDEDVHASLLLLLLTAFEVNSNIFEVTDLVTRNLVVE
jgi:hypothetical protein